MSALEKLFPNATPPDKWTPQTVAVTNADCFMVHHVVSTYDARDWALREAERLLTEASTIPVDSEKVFRAKMILRVALVTVQISGCTHERLDDGGTCLSCGGRDPQEKR
jgi:hypothetical protein